MTKTALAPQSTPHVKMLAEPHKIDFYGGGQTVGYSMSIGERHDPDFNVKLSAPDFRERNLILSLDELRTIRGRLDTIEAYAAGEPDLSEAAGKAFRTLC